MVDQHQDIELTKSFFDQWSLYRKALESNYLWHREAYAAVSRVLDAIAEPYSFLDLGAGDADWTSRILTSRKLSRYKAVDISEVALSLAEKNLAPLQCPKTFTRADFSQYVRENSQPWDVVLLSLSLHHLPASDKQEFFCQVSRIAGPSGRFLLYEPIRAPEETRDQVLTRWWEYALSHWTALSPDQLQQTREHIFGNDYPEPVEDYCAMAKIGGFRETRMHFVSGEELYAMVECLA